MTLSASADMIRLTDLAALRGIGKAAMSERVSKMVAAGLLKPVRDGRTKLIRLAEFEEAEAATVNLSKLAGAATKRARGLRDEAGPGQDDKCTLPIFDAAPVHPANLPPVVSGPGVIEDDVLPPVSSGGYPKAQTDLATYKAAIAKLELDQRLGRVVPVADVTEAMARCAESLVRGIDQLAASADDIAAAVAKQGASGARAALKAKARDLRELLAREMKLLGSPAETAVEPDVD